MREQEWYKDLMAKMITETENEKINSSEEMIKTLIDEIKLLRTKTG
ncbi:hypothetical protein ACDX78_14310 [Virgibacillus oceani]